MYKFDALWETHEFVITRLTENESKYNQLLSLLPTYVKKYEDGELKKQALVDLIEESKKICKALDSLYRKHLFTIKEIKLFIKENEVPEDKYVIVEALPDLIQTTEELMTTVQASKEILEFIEDQKIHGD
mgnify:CR=1 FL=1